jgi:glycosyltransferase involved in cell wall biosynthesis
MECFNVSSVVGGAVRVLLIAGLAESLINFRGPLIQALQARGMNVHVAAPELPLGSDLRAQLELRGCTVHDIKLSRTGTNPITDLRSLIGLYRLMQNIGPSIVLAYTIKPVIYGLLAARWARVPKRFALITGLGYAFQAGNEASQLQRVARLLYSWALAGATKVFFQNPDDCQLFSELGLAKSEQSVVVNGSGVDLAHYAPQPLVAQTPVFLMMARLLGDKGVREYAQAAAQLKQSYPNAEFRLAGWIDDQPDAISKTELDSWIACGAIKYLGRLDDVRSAIAQCSVYVLPSYREGTPRTVLEAMAIGRAIITTDAPGCRQTVEDGRNGFLVTVKSVKDLKNAMQKFIETPILSKTMGSESLNLVRNKFDVNYVNESMLRAMGILQLRMQQ